MLAFQLGMIYGKEAFGNFIRHTEGLIVILFVNVKYELHLLITNHNAWKRSLPRLCFLINVLLMFFIF